jgi:ADP-ribose pyrophosphatase YjhB (NUDIX family)/phosphoglycolate phosphatase-like HAD superfamily hydrolase
VLKASNYVLTQSGRPAMSLEKFRAEFQLPFTKFYDKHTPDVPMNQLENWFHAEFRESQHSVVALPHARDFLQFCRDRGVRMFLLSTIHADHFAVQNREIGFASFLEKPYTDVWDKREKIHEILRDHNLKADETLFIGDMEHDIATAQHGGIHSCAVLTGYNTLEQLRAAKPDLIVEHLDELKRVLLKNKFHLQPVEPEENVEPPLATVGALIFNAKREVLMIRTHKWSGLWGIPGGKIKRGEPALAALRREIKEETGLNITDIKFVLMQDCISSKEFYRDAHFVLLNYTCRCVAKKPRVVLNEEAREFQWLKLPAAAKLKLNKPTKILLAAVRQSKPAQPKA